MSTQYTVYIKHATKHNTTHYSSTFPSIRSVHIRARSLSLSCTSLFKDSVFPASIRLFSHLSHISLLW
jgi:hypothetical protein